MKVLLLNSVGHITTTDCLPDIGSMKVLQRGHLLLLIFDTPTVWKDLYQKLMCSALVVASYII